MCHGFELELWMRAVEQSRRRSEVEELKKQAKYVATPKPPEPEEQAVQPDPVPA